MKKLSLFKVGLILSIAGIIWIGLVSSESEKILKNFKLNITQTMTFDIEMQDSGIGFYKIGMPDFLSNTLFVQILDPTGNVIADKKIETKMSVNYFDFEYGGIYIIKITNLSEKPVRIDVEFGNTNALELIGPGIVLFFGQALMIIFTYKKLKNYRIAHPEENNS